MTKKTWSNDKTKVSCTEKEDQKIFGTFDKNYGWTRFKICKFFDYSKMSFLRTKKPPFDKTTWSNDKTKLSCTEKEDQKIFGTFDKNYGWTRFKICKFFDYSKMSFLRTKKPPFDKKTWSNVKTKVSWTEKRAGKIFGTDDQNHGLTRFKICKFLDYSKMSFLRTKTPPFDKKTWSNDKTKVSCTEKEDQKIFGTFDKNYGWTRFKICKFFDYSKMSFLRTKKPPFDKTTWSNDKTKVSCTEK